MDSINADKVALLKDQHKKVKAEADKERIANLWKDKNAIEEASLFSRIFFSWTEPILQYAKNNQLDIKEMGKVHHSDSVEV